MLKDPEGAGMAWCVDMAESHALLAGIVRVIHPEQYDAGITSMRHVAEVAGVAAALQVWHLPFNAVTCIFNRCTPPHRDTFGHPRMFDLLVNIGSHQEDARLVLEGVGLAFKYCSGTGLAFSGKLCRHEAEVPEGDRICLAYYMRSAVLGRAGEEIPDWMYRSDYQ